MIYIYPYKHLRNNALVGYKKASLSSDFFWQGREHLFFPTGKTAIHHTMNLLKLKREDEVCVFTSTDENYVSTCVTGPIFNYCKVSRVVTPQTKVFYIIHEFGLPHPKTKEIVLEGKNKGIPVIEDCAHTFDSEIDGKLVGSFGDYAIYSIPKHLPTEIGGILTGKRLNADTEYYGKTTANEVEQEFLKYIEYLPAFSEQRKWVYTEFKKVFRENGIRFLEFPVNSTPYFVIFESSNFKEIYQKMSIDTVELARIYIKNWVAIPTQPLAGKEDIDATIDKMSIYLKNR